ncbi:hypothetical protein M5689_024552 [Euphorbia peplus]|nr:hypothetical protein M5689_024552 [Euphorbia peplus]
MGSAISKAANGIGGVVGNVVSAPFKTIFGESCENVCAGPWDALCFIEHLCVTNLVKLLLILGLCYIGFLFFYLSFQLGICQCIGRSLCSMRWAACDGYWHGLKYITCFCWYKLKNAKWVYRHRRGRRQQPRFSDIESFEKRLKINSRKLQEMNAKNHKKNVGSSKRRRLK